MDATDQGEAQVVEEPERQERRSTLTRRGVDRARTLIQIRELEADWAAAYVYGAIAALVVVGGEELARRTNPLSATGVILVGATAIWLAKAFSALVGDWIRQVPVTARTVFQSLRHAWPTLAAALPAAFVQGLAGANIYSTRTGLLLAEYVSLAGLFLIGVWAAIASERPLGVRIFFPVVLAGIGWLIVGLELAAEHI